MYFEGRHPPGRLCVGAGRSGGQWLIVYYLSFSFIDQPIQEVVVRLRGLFSIMQPLECVAINPNRR